MLGKQKGGKEKNNSPCACAGNGRDEFFFSWWVTFEKPKTKQKPRSDTMVSR
jgi:hypothetical protein